MKPQILIIAWLIVALFSCKKDEAGNLVITTGEIQYGPFDKVTFTGTITPAVQNNLILGFRYGTDSTWVDYKEVGAQSTSNTTFSSEIKDLKINTRYYYVAFYYSDNKQYGKIKSFLTKEGKQLAIDTVIRTSNSLDLHVKLKKEGEFVNMKAGVILGTYLFNGSEVNYYTDNLTNLDYSVTVSNLKENTVYQAVPFVEIEGEKYLGEIVTISTKKYFSLYTEDSISLSRDPLIDPSFKRFLPKNPFQKERMSKEFFYANPDLFGNTTNILGSYQLKNEDAVLLYGHQNNNAWIAKYNRDVTVPWSFKIGGSDYDWINDIIEVDDGYIALGLTYSTDGDFVRENKGADNFVLKLNKSGNIIWKKCFGKPYNDYSIGIFQLPDKNFLLTGASFIGKENRTESYLVEIDGAGNLIKEYSHSIFFGSSPNNVLVTGDKALYLVGNTYLDSTKTGSLADADAFFAKFQGSDREWIKIFKGDPSYSYDDLRYVFQLSNGNLIGIGTTDSNREDFKDNGYNLSTWVVEFTTSGSLIKKDIFFAGEEDKLIKAMQIDGKIYLYINLPKKGYSYKYLLEFN